MRWRKEPSRNCASLNWCRNFSNRLLGDNDALLTVGYLRLNDYFVIRRANLIGQCESCGRIGELFQLLGHNYWNCPPCNADISRLVSLYRSSETTRPHGERESNLQNELTKVLQRFLWRSGFEGPARFSAWPENIAKEEHVN